MKYLQLVQNLFKKQPVETKEDFSKYNEVFLDIMKWSKSSREIDFSTIILHHYCVANTHNTFEIVFKYWKELIQENRFCLHYAFDDLFKAPVEAFYMYNIYSKDRNNCTPRESLDNFYKDLTERMLSHFRASRVDWFTPIKEYKSKFGEIK